MTDRNSVNYAIVGSPPSINLSIRVPAALTAQRLHKIIACANYPFAKSSVSLSSIALQSCQSDKLYYIEADNQTNLGSFSHTYNTKTERGSYHSSS